MNHNCKSRTALPTPEHTEDLDDLFASVAYKVPKAFEYCLSLVWTLFPLKSTFVG
ncbi:Hypothetical protein FKW44_010916 [Caligus rogercresseyi]|uniref:Uncharacterized protein n=1 Tax=Caligus rogercresseyi TaxID=217165 RepID=A0A7T8HHD8_CALRO|nr:Hypothetical protein FKW44_010916 [Caligus rogercresseyi]